MMRSVCSNLRLRPQLACCLLFTFCLPMSGNLCANDTTPSAITAQDHPWDDGTQIDVVISLPAAFPSGVDLLVEKATEFNGLYEEVARVRPSETELEKHSLTVISEKNLAGEPYWFRVSSITRVDNKEVQSSFLKTPEKEPGICSRQLIDGRRVWMGIIMSVICGSVIFFIRQARQGKPLKIRPIAGLEAIEEAVGRATEMGRSCLFVPGIQDMNDIQTIAGLTLLSRVAEQAAEYDCLLETPTSKSLVMTAAKETVATAFLKAGRPDAYNDDLIYYVTDEQFAYVSFLTGKMVREKPAACFYLGAFYAESLILAETGNSIGAIQIAGSAQPAQLPFFVAACDYTLIGEEFFAASAYLSGDPDQMGSLKGQDVGKIIVGGLILVGVFLMTLEQFSSSPVIASASDYLVNTMLKSL